LPGGTGYENSTRQVIGSLHYNKKKIEAEKLDYENKKIAKRIISIKPKIPALSFLNELNKKNLEIHKLRTTTNNQVKLIKQF
jgi:hypothetical protein